MSDPNASNGWSPSPKRGPDAPNEPFVPPPLQGADVELRAITPNDYGYIQAMELGPELNWRWRHRGTTPSPDQWLRTLWDNVLVQYLVSSPRRADPIGLVFAYHANFQDQHVYVAAARFEPHRRSPTMLLGVALFIDYVFSCWSFRKLYFTTPEYNYAEIASGLGRYFEVEGCLRDHLAFGGRRWDQLTLAVYREDWEDRAHRFLKAARRPAPPQARVRMPRDHRR